MTTPAVRFCPGAPLFAMSVEVRYLRRESRQLHAEVDVLCDWARRAAP
jgi:hypothetical protein